jgi:error-prone DNA polymerase
VVRALSAPLPPLFAHSGLGREQPVVLPKMTMGEQVVEDYAHLRLSLKTHPLALMRPELAAESIVPARELVSRGDGKRVVAEGLVLVRQRPGTASGVIFLTLEDETGVCNVVVWPHLFEKARAAVLNGRLLRVRGKLQIEQGVIHLVAETILDRTARLTRLADQGLKTTSRDFH